MSTLNTPGERKIVTFSLGEQMFGIDMKALIEIREWENPTPLPSVPAYIKGVTNLRGTVVPVVGLAERLGWTPSVLQSQDTCVVYGMPRAALALGAVERAVPLSAIPEAILGACRK
jgi:purine-binding chemotaxis protein CheW